MTRRPMIAALLSALALVAGCASGPALPPPDSAPLLHDAAFAPPTEAIDRDAVFALSAPMRAYLDAHRNAFEWRGDRRQQLLDLLYRKGELALRYDAAATRTAAEAFDARAGNCLSLVVMTTAFAKALDLPVRLRQVFVDETWTRSGDLIFAAGHVNLALDSTRSLARISAGDANEWLVDFLPGVDLRSQRAQTIGEATVVSMFMNNRAAERLAAGRVDQAYWYAREAVLADPRHSMAFNTLGVVYLRQGLVREAQAVFDAVLRREPENPKVLGNLVSALRRQGRDADAQAVAQRLAAVEPVAPFHWFDAGLQALREQDWARARELFRRELRREPSFHEIHFRLAQAELGLGNVAAARRHLVQAQEATTSAGDAAIYAAKLDHLNTLLR